MDSISGPTGEGLAQSPIGVHHLQFDTVDSTNSLAAAYAGDRANHGFVFSARVQTRGRGQYQRAWQAPPGSSILLSVLLFPPPRLRRPVVMTAWAAISVCRTIERYCGLAPALKWPNDVLINGKKVCGILCEGGNEHLIAGIGLNVSQSANDFALTGLFDATSLAVETSREVEMAAITHELIDQLNYTYRELEDRGANALEENWKARFGLIGGDVIAEQMDGALESGRLLVLSLDGVLLQNGEQFMSLLPEQIRHIRKPDVIQLSKNC